MSKPANGNEHTGRHDVSRPPTAHGAGPGCDEVRPGLLEAHQPGSPLDAATEAHLSGCASCRALRAQLALVDDVTRAEAPPLPAGFELALRRRLREQPLEVPPATRRDDRAAAPRRRTWARVALAAAAAVLVTAGAVTVATRWRGPGPVTYHQLHLAVEATRDCDELLFDVELPDGVRALSSLPGALGRGRSLSWRSPLRAGTNEFDLPLVADRRQGEVRVTLRLGAQTWTGQVSLGDERPRAGAAGSGHQLRLALVVGPATAPRGGGRSWQ